MCAQIVLFLMLINAFLQCTVFCNEKRRKNDPIPLLMGLEDNSILF